ncbi:MAG TPA: L,D-transpeptidase family protein [Afifellaceae bacterium]|nr:L,D-transpeptidase family protein [Afifellaceae bacterium]
MVVLRGAASAAGFVLALLLASGGQAEPQKIAALEVEQAGPAAEADPVLSPAILALKTAIERLPAGAAQDKTLAAELRKLYEGRAFEPLWIRDGAPTAQAQALVDHLAAAEDEGLRPEEYAVPDLAASDLASTERVATAEVELSRAIARFVLHVAAGKADPASISKHITVAPPRPNLADALSKLADDEDARALMRRFAPPHPQYAALRDKLAELRRQKVEETVTVVPDGRSLRLGDSDPRVALLRERLGLEADADADAELFDEGLAEAVSAFQREHRLTADGIVGPRTLLALNGPSREEAIAAIQVNMERLRWLPRDLGAFHVMVNVPEFQLRIVKNDRPVHETRVIVGTKTNPTPTFSNAIDHLIVNPYWNVPASILTKEMLPEIQRDPYYFARHNYQVLAHWEGKTYVVDPMMVDWNRVDTSILRVRQLPGEANALGRIKFMFPNQHAVYLHDTPTKHLFKRDFRAYSHGCVRVDDPMAFADALLAHEPEWNAAALQKYFGGPERRINLNRQVPVHLAYFTARVTDDGKLVTFADLYGYDSQVRQQLGLAESM